MIVVLMGVSGSGKTTVGKALAERLGWRFDDADALHPAANVDKMRHGVPLTDEDRTPWIRAVSRLVHDRAVDGQDVVVACSALRKWQRDALRAAGGDIRFVHLAGDPREIDRRLRARVGHFMPESLLQSQFDTLEVPDPTEALVVDVGPPVAAIVESILRGLHLVGS